jgi:effector-binding domain-containing protein
MAMEIEVTDVPAQRVYALSSGPSPIPREQLSPLIWRLFDQLDARLHQAGIIPPAIHLVWYERVTGYLDAPSIRVWVGYTAPSATPSVPSASSAPLAPAADMSPIVLEGAHAAVSRVVGPPQSISASWDQLIEQVRANGGHTIGWARQVHEKAYPSPESEWVTQLQLPFTGDLRR